MATSRKQRIIQSGGLMVLVFLVLFVFGNVCPIEHILGIPCPGCNMFTAFYWLSKGNFALSWYYHPLAVPCLLYLIVIFIGYVKDGEAFLYRRFTKGITIAFFTLLGIVYLIRMLTIFPQAPMQLNKHAVWIRLWQFITA